MPLFMAPNLLRPAPVSPLSIAYTDDMETASETTAYSQGSTAIGTAASDRVVVVCMWTQSATGGSPALTSATIAGETLTTRVQQGANSNNFYLYVLTAVVASGTTGTLAFNFSANVTGISATVYELQGGASETPAASDSGSGGASQALSAAVANGGVALCLGASGSLGTASTFSVTTQDGDALHGNKYLDTGSDEYATGQTINETVTYPSSTDSNASILATWNPQ